MNEFEFPIRNSRIQIRPQCPSTDSRDKKSLLNSCDAYSLIVWFAGSGCRLGLPMLLRINRADNGRVNPVGGANDP